MIVRSLIFYIIFYVTLILTSLLLISTSLFVPVKRSQKIAKFWIINILKTLKFLCGIEWSIEGKENIPNKPFVMVSNHQGPWESLFLQTLYIPTSSIVKKEILLIPFFGWAISQLNPIAINRKKKLSSLRKVISLGGERIKCGYAVLIFPEGTRRRPLDGIGKFGNSCGVLAVNESVPIIPICHNSGNFWVNRSIQKKQGNITIVIGKPISGSNPKELSEKAYLWMKKTYDEID